MNFDNSNPPPVQPNDYGRRLNLDKPHIYLFDSWWRVSPMPRKMGKMPMNDPWFTAYQFVGNLNNKRKGFSK